MSQQRITIFQGKITEQSIGRIRQILDKLVVITNIESFHGMIVVRCQFIAATPLLIFCKIIRRSPQYPRIINIHIGYETACFYKHFGNRITRRMKIDKKNEIDKRLKYNCFMRDCEYAEYKYT